MDRNPDRPALELAGSRPSARKLLLALVAAEIALVVLDYLLNYSYWVDSRSIRRLFNIAREDSLANFLASVQSLAVAAIAWLVYLHARRAPGGRRWAVVATFFAYLGLDDGARIHERVGTATESWFEFFPSYTWQIVYVPFFAAAAVFTIIVIWRETRERILRFAAFAAPTCWAVGTILDYIDGREGTEERIAESFGLSTDDLGHYSKVTEEFLEALGTSIFLFVFLRLLIARAGAVTVTLRDDAGEGAGR